MINCPLCKSPFARDYDQDKFRSYLLCGNCSLIFVSRDSIMSSGDEKKRYDSHENSEEDVGYIEYLKKISDASVPFLSPRSLGLDFGCGKTTVLAQHFEASGMLMDSYDLYFHPDEKIWNKQYDFIILSEVIEHLREPLEIMQKLNLCLKPEGTFLIKTKLYPKRVEDFKNWFYKRDLTHVQFFSEGAFASLSQLLGLSGPQLIGEDLFLFKK